MESVFSQGQLYNLIKTDKNSVCEIKGLTLKIPEFVSNSGIFWFDLIGEWDFNMLDSVGPKW